ncbi:hypothetical protein [Kitasatospora purpeofusca]|uniref:Uncharacterized protein n=1 Tax=Kitasatospora purpeofusca TaxID=67352 RepID=A0ABZ1UAF6_9ACTN|nr:hypothetical protein [Kitasatospora purpeofusca]
MRPKRRFRPASATLAGSLAGLLAATAVLGGATAATAATPPPATPPTGAPLRERTGPGGWWTARPTSSGPWRSP